MSKDNITNARISVGQSLLRAFQAGWIAAKFGESDNPYYPDTEEHLQWNYGYRKYLKDSSEQ
jgi:hypothetical protein